MSSPLLQETLSDQHPSPPNPTTTHPPSLCPSVPKPCQIRKFHHKACGQFISRVFAHHVACSRHHCVWTEVNLQVERACPWCDASFRDTFSDTHSRLGEISGSSASGGSGGNGKGRGAGTCEMKMLRHKCCGSSYACSVIHKPDCAQQDCVWTFMDDTVDTLCAACEELGQILAGPDLVLD